MPIISDNHKNTLDSSLRIVERNLQRIKTVLEQDDLKRQKTILYKKEDDIGARTKPEILKVIKTMLEEINEMKGAFGLEIEIEPISMEVAASLSEIWVLLEDLRANKLKSYGHVSDSEKNLLEPKVTKLLEELNEIETALHKSIDINRKADAKGGRV